MELIAEDFILDIERLVTALTDTGTEMEQRKIVLDAEQQDLLHYIESTDLTPSQMKKVVKRLQDIRRERREIKNQQYFMTYVLAFSHQIRGKIDETKLKIDNLKTELTEVIENKKYNYRVLTEEALKELQ